MNFRRGLILELRRRGYSVVALVPPGDEYEPALRELATAIHHVPISPRGMSAFGDVLLLRNYFGALRKLRPVAFLGFTVKPNIYGSIAAQLNGVPAINNITGLGTVFAHDGPVTRLVEMLYRLALRRSSTVFFQNRDDLQLFEAKRLVSREQTALLPGSGVDLAHFVPQQRNQRPFTFLFAARLLWEKGIGDFVDAARRLRTKYPDLQFNILGILQPESPEAVSRNDIERWEKEGIIRFLGAADDVRPVLGEADCVVLPSRYREGVPRILLEASAMGIPVIATDVPGCRDAVDDGVTGFVCASKSVESLSSAMERVATMAPGEWKAMGAAARERMERQFGEQIILRSYLDALDRISGQARGKRAA